MKAECTTITENNEEFIQSTYNGISVYQRKKDGFINVTKLCFDGGRDFRTFKRSKRWNEIIQYYLKFEAVQNCTPIYELRKSYNLMQGQFLIPDLVHFVAEWISLEYSFTVKHIMDSINDKVHDVLEKNHLPDTVENSKPIFKEVAKRITLKIDVDLVNGQCWGVRDDVHRLDQNEQDDLRSDIDKYNSIKQQLNANPNDTTLKKQLNESKAKLESEWKWFIPT